jgi:ABC-type branched-subunit amino acid transport system substrate-binding protein
VASVAAAACLAACSSGGGGATGGGGGATGGGSSSSTWVIGGIVDQTGPGANTGASSKSAFQFWVNQFNAQGGAGGRKLQVDYCDSKSTPAGGAQCAAQVGSVNSHIVVLLSALPAAQGAQTRLASDVTLSIIPVLLPKGGSSSFQVVPLFGTVVQPMIAMAKASKISKLGVIYTSDSSGTAQLGAIKQAAAGAGLSVVASPMDPTATDVTPQLVQLRSQGAGLIFSATLGSPTNVVLSSAATVGLTLPVVVGNGNVTNNFLQSLSGGIPQNLFGLGTMAKGTAFPAAVTKAWTSFQASYQQAVGKPVDSVGSSFAYTSCLMKAALDGTKASSADAIQKYLLSKTTACLGSPLKFANPALNVASGVPLQVVKASSDDKGSWVPASTGF